MKYLFASIVIIIFCKFSAFAQIPKDVFIQPYIDSEYSEFYDTSHSYKVNSLTLSDFDSIISGSESTDTLLILYWKTMCSAAYKEIWENFDLIYEEAKKPNTRVLLINDGLDVEMHFRYDSTNRVIGGGSYRYTLFPNDLTTYILSADVRSKKSANNYLLNLLNEKSNKKNKATYFLVVNGDLIEYGYSDEFLNNYNNKQY